MIEFDRISKKSGPMKGQAAGFHVFKGSDKGSTTADNSDHRDGPRTKRRTNHKRKGRH